MRWTRESAAWLVPPLVWALALPIVAAIPRLAPTGPFGAPFEALALAAAATAAALHRPWGGGLGLGTLAVLPAIVRLGVAPAMLLALGAALAAEALRRALEKRRPAPLPERRRPVRIVAQAALAGLGAGAAGVAWAALGADLAVPAMPLAGAAALAALAWLVPPVLFEVATRRALREERARRILPALSPLALELPGFAIGALALAVARRADWTLAGLWLAVAALLALEAARQELAASASARRLAEAERISRAGAAMAAGAPELERIARTILGECRAIAPFAWFQLELYVPDLGRTSFAAAEGGELAEGEPVPPPAPPALPGIHRREPWRLLVRELVAEGERLATLRLWCDPRRLEGRAESLLDGLVPSMAASVRGAFLDRVARLDKLTGAWTRRAFEPRLTEAFAACREEGRPLSLVVGDLDHFKRINDTWGHPAGDRALKAVARVLVASTRGREICARWGGEEFVLLLEDTPGEAALEVAERLRRRIEDTELDEGGERVPLSMSFGVACFPELAVRGGDELLAVADGALYAAKRLGRNLALLELGRGRLRTGSGRLIESDESLAPPEAPVFFA
jgi:diguanylate cyclase (GGDEF)-like protein